LRQTVVYIIPLVEDFEIFAVGDEAAPVEEVYSTLEGGTSISASLDAAIFARITEERLAVGKSLVGLPNLTLYVNLEMFIDTTVGDFQSNGGCRPSEFSAVAGWDPSLGSVRRDTMLG
jgi:hypothetical protein